MLEISSTHSNLLSMFDPQISNNPMLFATLLGHAPGRAFVDDAINPSQCMIRTNEALVFFSKQVSQAFFDQGLDHIKQFGHVAIIWRSTTSALQVPKADKTIQRLDYPEYDSNNPYLANIKNNGAPNGFEFRVIDKNLLEKCEWRKEIENF